MTKGHCWKSDCATVIYRQYLSPVVRYRYEDEDWQEIEGDSYKIEQSKGGQIDNEQYYPRFYYVESNPNGGLKRGAIGQWQNIRLKGKIISADLVDNQGNIIDYFDYYSTGKKWTDPYYLLVTHDGGNDAWAKSFQNNWGIEIIEFVPFDSNVEESKPCKFTVFKEKSVAHTETRGSCPKVEQLPCRLSDIYKEIKIEKTPYLSTIQVLDYGLGAKKISGVPYPLPEIFPIPDECLNIYRKELYDVFPSEDPSEENDPIAGDYIAQICSSFGCPRPKYEVICNCDEKCPPGTCEVRCGDHLCCYDVTTGKSVKQIPIASFFPTNTKGGNSR